MKKNLILILASLLLFSCTTPAKHQVGIHNPNNIPVANLVRIVAVPDANPFFENTDNLVLIPEITGIFKSGRAAVLGSVAGPGETFSDISVETGRYTIKVHCTNNVRSAHPRIDVYLTGGKTYVLECLTIYKNTKKGKEPIRVKLHIKEGDPIKENNRILGIEK